MKIALVHLSYGVDGTPASPMVDHLGLESIAGYVATKGHDVTIFDSGIQSLNEIQLLNKISLFNPDLVGFTVNYANIHQTRGFAKDLREILPLAPFIAGGHYATFHNQQLLSKKIFDAVVIGEGEEVIASIAEAGPSMESWLAIPGLSYRSGGNIIQNPSVPSPELHHLSLPDRSLLNDLNKFHQGCFKVAIEASRGCSHKCNFCSIAACQELTGDQGRRRTRTPQSIASEVEGIFNSFGYKDYWFMDANFLGSSKNDVKLVLDIAEAIGSIDKSLTFEIDARADSVNLPTMKALKKAGVNTAFLGVESFYQASLNKFNKHSNVKDNISAINILHDLDIRPIIGTIMFHPDSTIEQIQADHAVLREIGYEKTQMLFRLKKYKTSSASEDCFGRGISHMEDYGYEFSDPHVRLIWDIFDYARLHLLDAIFIHLTATFREGRVEVPEFRILMDQTFHGLGPCMDIILEAIGKGKATRHDRFKVEQDVCNVINEVTKAIPKTA